MYSTVVDVVHITDALLSSLVFCVIVFRTRSFWRLYDKQQKALIISYLGFTLAVAYTSFELYAGDVNVGLRSYIVLVASLVSLYAMGINKKPGLLNFNGKPLARGTKVKHMFR